MLTMVAWHFCVSCQTLNIYLCVVGSAWLIWLAWDINVYISTMKEYEKKQSKAAWAA